MDTRTAIETIRRLASKYAAENYLRSLGVPILPCTLEELRRAGCNVISLDDLEKSAQDSGVEFD